MRVLERGSLASTSAGTRRCNTLTSRKGWLINLGVNYTKTERQRVRLRSTPGLLSRWQSISRLQKAEQKLKTLSGYTGRVNIMQIQDEKVTLSGKPLSAGDIKGRLEEYLQNGGDPELLTHFMVVSKVWHDQANFAKALHPVFFVLGFATYAIISYYFL